MADAPSGGGISEWGAFEIVLVLLLAIGLLSRLNGDTMSPGTPDTKTTINEKTVDTTKASCGLLLARPHSLESVENFVTLVGTAGTCNWIVDTETALYAQVVDSKGMAVSSYIAVPAQTRAVDGTVPFSASIPLTSVPTTSKGYLTLISAHTTISDTPKSVQIPLTFKR